MSENKVGIIFEKDGKYFQEVQIKWGDATPEERENWQCYQQDHIKRMVEVEPPNGA